MISAVILTYNEEENISSCIKTLLWCDEIIIIDDYSNDKTIECIEELRLKKIKIYKHHLDDNFSSQRNFALEKAVGNWILFIDADEYVTNSLQFEILNVINESIDNINGYYFKRLDYIWGKPLHFGESNNITLLRLAKKDKGKWIGNVHESWQITGKTTTLKNPIIHHPHQTIAIFLKEINYYTDLRAKYLYNQRVSVYWWTIIIYPLGKFIQNYLIRLGIFDGIRGLIFAVLMSLHSFLVRGKLWYLLQQKRT
jgi:glycosyltransferase involved in cell wall biosynthesis